MTSLSRRSLVRGVSVAAPAVLLGDDDPVRAALLDDRGRRGCADPDRVAKLLAKDMVGKHQGRMHGVPSNYNWAKRPRVGRGNHAGKYQALSVWGQIYEDAKGSPARNVRVACKDIGGWILSERTGRWRRVDATKGVFGHNYVEDFAGNAYVPADLRDEPDGSVSSTLGNGYNFHFSPNHARVWIDPDDIDGIVALYSAKVIVDDPAGPDERHLARYLASAGADYWLNKTVGPKAGVTVDDVGIGKARYLDARWKTVTMSTIGIKRLRRTAPPVCLRGRGR